MSAARNYLHSLNGELEGTGVYAGTARSESADAPAEAIPAELPGGIEITTVDPGRPRRALLGHVHPARPRRAGLPAPQAPQAGSAA
jgi:hypothetical protein